MGSGHTSDELVGTWRLVSASTTTPTGERSETPYGPNPTGLLTYTADGRMAAMISHSGRKSTSSLARPEEQAEAFKTFLGYAGRYRLEGDEVIHSVEISSIQNYVGQDLLRTVKFEGDQIVLVTPPTPVKGKIQTFELIWRRLAVES